MLNLEQANMADAVKAGMGVKACLKKRINWSLVLKRQNDLVIQAPKAT